MPINRRPFRVIEALTLLALVTLFAFAFYFWDFVERAHKRAHNTLGEMHLHNPTSELFLWATVGFILYCLARAWGSIAEPIFRLSPEAAATWRDRLLLVRTATTFICLALTLHTISTYVPDFIDKLPWP